MLTTFVVIGSIGLLVATLSLLVGDFFDDLPSVDFVPDGALSTTTVSATFAGFGFGGAIAMTVFGVETTWLVVLIATVIGLGSWGSSWFMYRQLEKQSEPEGAGDIAQLTGTTGTVITAPYKVGSAGELSLIFRAQPHKMNFYCDEKVTVGQQVVVTAVLSSSQVKVEKKVESEAASE